MKLAPFEQTEPATPGGVKGSQAARLAVFFGPQKILNSAWGMMGVFLSYKASHAGKVFIKVSPRFSSQECAKCGHIHPANRQTQSDFICQKCGHTENADQNAAEVIRKRG